MASDRFVSLLLVLSVSLTFGVPIELPEITIPEHTPRGHLLLTLNSSTAAQRSSYRFVSNNNRELQHCFSLNSSTGQLHVANDIDREKICTQPHAQCKFLLKIFELFQEKLYYIPIVIEDVNDHRPLFPYESSRVELHISENSPPHQSKLFLQQAYDQDQVDDQKQLHYELKDTEKTFPFRLETNVDISNRLALVLIQPLDRERVQSYNCTLRVLDTARHDEQLHITIIIDDVNDQSPVFESETYSVELSESTPVNTTIIRVHATDADAGLNGQLTYEFTDASKPFASTFAVDKQTGLIYLRAPLDFEQRSSYVFYIQARDAGKEPRSSQTLVNVTILDENDCAPKITFRFLPEITYSPEKDLIEISESYSVDKFFAQIIVTDEDSGDRGQTRLWFEIIDEQKETDQSFYLYPIDNSTYFFNRTKAFDYELQQWHRLIFYAQDFDQQKPLQTNQILTIHVLDENDNPPRFRHSLYHLKLDENNAEDAFISQIEAFDADDGENARLTYDILTNETSFPFYIEPSTGRLFCSKSLDREKRDRYDFYIVARDHGDPNSLSANVHVRVDLNDINDNRPKFVNDRYDFTVEENSNAFEPVGVVRAYDLDLNSKLTYSIVDDADSSSPFRINNNGELFFRDAIDREMEDFYAFNVSVSDQFFRTDVRVTMQILDVNDCVPQWRKPAENNTVLIINKDRVPVGATIVTFEALDDDEKSSGNGLVTYSLEEMYPAKDQFLALANTGELVLNGTATIGRYRLLIRAQDNGKFVQHASLMQFYLFIGDNQTNGSLFYDLHHQDHFFKINSFSTTKRVFLLSTFFISMAIILAFIVSMVLILLCRYRRQKYLYYIKCKAAQAVVNGGSHPHDPRMMIVDNRLNDYDEKNCSSNSSKLSLENLHQKRLIDHSSSPSYTGANIYTANHPHHNEVSSAIKLNQTTSDYYSNSSKHEEDVDEWTDDQQQQQQRAMIDRNNPWSIEKILYPDWLYKGSKTTPTVKKSFNTSTFIDGNAYRTLEINGSTTSSSSTGRRTMSSSLMSNGQPSPKQVRFGAQQRTIEQTRSYPHLSTSIRQLRANTAAVTSIVKDEAHDTFI